MEKNNIVNQNQKKSKYNNIIVNDKLRGKFDSKLEHSFVFTLEKISIKYNLKLLRQVKMIVSSKLEGDPIDSFYIADYILQNNDNKIFIIDVKTKITTTPVFKLKISNVIFRYKNCGLYVGNKILECCKKIKSFYNIINENED